VHEQFIQLLFSVISYVPSAIQEENNMGTVAFTIRFFKLSIFVDVIFSLLSILVGMTISSMVMMTPCMGLWPILMCDLVIQCYQYPEMPRKLCCLPMDIKSKWYPLVLIGLFTIFFGPQLSLWAGLGVGYLYVFGYINFLKTSEASLKAWENRWPFKSYKNDPAFRVSQVQATGSNASATYSSGGAIGSNFGGGNQSATATQQPGGARAQRPVEEETKSSFTAFKGRGTSLGSDLESSQSSTASSSWFGGGSGSKQTEEAKESQPVQKV